MKKIQLTFLGLLLLMPTHLFAFCQASMPETAPDSAFIDHENGLVTDIRTGLMWRKCTEGQSGSVCSVGVKEDSIYTWQEALEHVQSVNSNSSDAFNDWRLPNKKEMESIMANNCVFPAINEKFFYLFSDSGVYWTSTTFAGDGNKAWVAQFRFGAMELVPDFDSEPLAVPEDHANKSKNRYFIRLVRGG